MKEASRVVRSRERVSLRFGTQTLEYSYTKRRRNREVKEFEARTEAQGRAKRDFSEEGESGRQCFSMSLDSLLGRSSLNLQMCDDH